VYCKACARRQIRRHREKNRSRETVDYPAGALCSRCGQWGVIKLDPKTGKPSTRLGSDWGMESGRVDGLPAACKWCKAGRKDRRPRQLRTCPDCDGRPPRELKHFGRVLHADGTESYSEFCK